MNDNWIRTRTRARLPAYRYEVVQRGSIWLAYDPDGRRLGEYGSCEAGQRACEAIVGRGRFEDIDPNVHDELRALLRLPGTERVIRGFLVVWHRYPDAHGVFEICPEPARPGLGAYWIASPRQAAELLTADRRDRADASPARLSAAE